jgi:hypothetical protein
VKGEVNVKTQKGAALVVVLSLLTISLMVGLSSMQSSQVDEVLAGNHRAQTQAQMISEDVASMVLSGIVANGVEAEEINSLVPISEWDSLYAFYEENLSNCEYRSQGFVKGVACFVRLGESYFLHDPGYYIYALGVVDSDGSVVSRSRELIIRLRLEEWPTPPLVNAAFTCFGPHCDHTYSGGGQQGERAFYDGRDYLVPSSFSCNGDSCDSSLNPDGEPVANIYYPDVAREPYNGSVGSGDAEKAIWIEYISEILEIPGVVTLTDDVSSNIGGRADPRVMVIDGDIKNSGNYNTSGVIVVKAGSKYTMSGTGHHEGLIIVEPGGMVEEEPYSGGSFEIGSGTARVFGGVVKLDGDAGMYDMDLRGNISLRYSSEALSLLSGRGGATDESNPVIYWDH